MAGILSTLARLFSGKPQPSIVPAAPPAPGGEVTPDTAFAPIDSNTDMVGWFNGGHVAGRDSIDSNPDTARWYRKPRFVSPEGAAHRISVVNGGQ